MEQVPRVDLLVDSFHQKSTCPATLTYEATDEAVQKQVMGLLAGGTFAHLEQPASCSRRAPDLLDGALALLSHTKFL